MNVSKLKAQRLENVSRVRIIYSRILNLVTGWGVWSASRAGRFVFWERAFGTPFERTMGKFQGRYE